ncbi:DUF2975 domain-containing protein [Adlercreutzia sp. ZJ473]|uniref:DUF2975 domain-containing protein n=1 Tax=Adlercreutzia sp. ZJ473 TaxID=2722822 RepID=UPI001556A36B|nr:DUF2975 domain-containing protein [Adlercreutzia sp. ZJ473]
MADTEVKARDVEGYLAAISRGSAVAVVILRAIVVLVLALNVLPFLLLFLNTFLPCVEIVSKEGTVVDALLVVAQAFCFVLPLWILSNVCQEVSRGISPFSMAQVKRMRIVVGMIVTFAVIDFFLEPCSVLFNCNGIMLGGYVHAYVYKVNMAAVVAALALFLLSFVFKYGVMLQSVSDDVI